MRVYCEHSALHAKLRGLQREGRITLVGFPYDPNSRSRPIRQLALPSRAQIGDLNLPIGDMKFRIGEMVTSTLRSSASLGVAIVAMSCISTRPIAVAAFAFSRGIAVIFLQSAPNSSHSWAFGSFIQMMTGIGLLISLTLLNAASNMRLETDLRTRSLGSRASSAQPSPWVALSGLITHIALR